MLPPKELQNVNRQLKKFGFKNLAEYFGSDLWKKNKEKIRYIYKVSDSEIKCCCCNVQEREGNKVELHHKSYKGLGEESVIEVEWVCRSCHETIHDTLNKLLNDKNSLLFFVTEFFRLAEDPKQVSEFNKIIIDYLEYAK